MVRYVIKLVHPTYIFYIICRICGGCAGPPRVIPLFFFVRLRPKIIIVRTFPVYFEDLRLINKNCVLSPARLGDRVLHIGKLILPIERKFKNIKKVEK